MVADSWLRSVAAGLDADASRPPITLSRDPIADDRDQHPLAIVLPLLYDVLGRAAEECDSVLAVADARGQLRWVRGRPQLLRQAESIGFVEGAQWDERHAGTNAPGTALWLDAPGAINSAEHFVHPVQRWSCGAVLGVPGVTGGPDVGSPQTMAIIRAAARMAESELARSALAGSSRPAPPTPDWTPELAIHALGRPECAVSVGRRTPRLSPRHSEILVILAMAPHGLSGDELAYLLYPRDQVSSTVRAELV